MIYFCSSSVPFCGAVTSGLLHRAGGLNIVYHILQNLSLVIRLYFGTLTLPKCHVSSTEATVERHLYRSCGISTCAATHSVYFILCLPPARPPPVLPKTTCFPIHSLSVGVLRTRNILILFCPFILFSPLLLPTPRLSPSLSGVPLVFD